jgi:O-antigen/teichoic acid export membrane protein
MGLSIALGATCLVLLALFAGPLAQAMPLATSTGEIWLLGIMITMDAILGVPLGWLRITGAAGRHALASGCRATVQAAIVAVLLHNGFGVSGVLAGGAAASLLAATWLCFRQARDTGISVHARGWPRLLSYGAPLLGSGIASFVLGSADRWLLAGSVPAASLGHYALAMRFAMIVAMLMQPFDMWWYARRMAVLDLRDGLARSARAIRIGVCGIAVAGALTAASGPMLIFYLAPSSYTPAMAMVPWLVLALSVQMLSSLVNVGCYAGRTTLTPLAVNCAAAATALGAYLLLIPHYGVPGAIAATLLAQTTRLVLFTILAQRRVRINLPYAATMLLAASASVCAIIPQYVRPGALAAVSTIAAALVTTAIAATVTWLSLSKATQPV